jgi:hypothetical protein
MFKFLAEVADLIPQRLAGGRSAEKEADDSQAGGGGALFHQPGLEQEFGKLLERGFQFAHRSSPLRRQHGCQNGA